MSTPISETIHIVLGSDEKFAQHLAVTVASILHNARSDVAFHILHDGLSAATIDNIQSCAAIRPASFEFILLKTDEFADLPLRPKLSLMAYARMKIPSLLPHLSRALYLDSDIAVCDDLMPLWRSDLHGHPIGACLDYVSPFKVKHLNLDARNFFNSGVMLMDLEAMRAMGFNDIVVAGFRESPRRFNHDQEFLNLIFAKNWQRLPSRWNVVIHHDELRSRRLKIHPFDEFRDALADPGIIHYTGTKPSMYLHDSVFKDRYWFYLAMTPWRDYRMPQPTLSQIVRKWRKRLKRRALELLAGIR